MPKRLVLDPPSHFVHTLVCQPHDMERVSHLGRIRQHRVVDLAIRRRQIQRCPHNPITPVIWLIVEPAGRSVAVSVRNDIE